MLSVEKAREQVNIIRQRVSAPVNMNFFCHKAVDADPKREAGWKQRLAPRVGPILRPLKYSSQSER